MTINVQLLTLKSESGEPFKDTLLHIMRPAVVKLGLDPKDHDINLRPHQLLIFCSGTRSYSLTFEASGKQ